MNKNVKLNYSSTLNGSVLLILTCESNTTDEQILHVTCHSNGTWIPDPDQFNCLSISAGTIIVKYICTTNNENNNMNS